MKRKKIPATREKQLNLAPFWNVYIISKTNADKQTLQTRDDERDDQEELHALCVRLYRSRRRFSKTRRSKLLLTNRGIKRSRTK